MIISKDSNNNWTPVATGNGTFVGTKAAFDAVKDDLPDNTVAYTTDDGESVTDEITDGDMRAVTSNAVYDALNPTETTITGTSRTVSVTVGKTDWFTLTAPTIPSNKRVVRWFATVNISQARVAVGYTTSSTPNGVIITSDESGDVTIALAAVVVDR